MKKFLLGLGLCWAWSCSAESILRRDNGAEPKSIDPQLATESAGSAVIYDLFEGLTSTAIDGSTVPGLAEKWEVSEDGKSYTFHLRPQAKWSDGQPVKAQDVVYGWQRAVNPATASEYAFILGPVKNASAITKGEIKDLNQLGVKAVDDHTLKVELEQPTPYFIELMTHYTTHPARKDVIEKYGKQWTQPGKMVSNGAYKLTEWVPQGHIKVEKSPNYWDAAKVKIDQVYFYPLEDENIAVKRYQAGELDYVLALPIEQLKWAKENVPDDLKINPKLSTYIYYFNLKKPPFDNAKLREAFNLAIDRPTITEKITRAGQIPAYGFLPPNISNGKPYSPDYAQLSKEERLEKARKAYQEAGYSKDKPLKVELLYNTNEGHKKIAVAIAAMLKQNLGVETELVNKEWKVTLDDMNKGAFQMARYAWQGDYNDPSNFLELFMTGNEMNKGSFSNADYDGKMKEAATTQDLAKRADIYAAAEKILMDNYAIMPVYHYVSVELMKPYVKGYKSNVKQIMPSKYLSIEK